MSSMGETLYNTVARSMRSVFIGNLPLDTTEDQLKEICSEIGPLINVKIFTDNDSNKPKVYGFCEYKDKEMAQSAVRNLDGYLLRNSPLRVHIASSEKSKEEMESLQGLVTEQGETSTDATSEKAPEEISKAVASLPAEQMFELMKQMKMCIENNPTEARNLLLQNPQLAYALLQAQVIMRIVDPEVSLQILNRPLSVQVPTSLAPESKIPTETVPQMVPPVNETPPAFPAFSPAATQLSSSAASAPRAPANPPLRPPLHGDRVPVMAASAVPPMPSPFADRDMRIMGDRDMRQLPLGDRDMRQLPILSGDKEIRQSHGDQDYRTLSNNRPFDPRFRNMQGSDSAGSRGSSFDRMRTGANSDPRTAFEGRVAASARVEDPRKALSAASVNSRAGIVSAPPATVGVSSSSTTQPVHHPPAAPAPAASALAPQDQEKAALIMQVLQLSDQQIAMLPPEQRQSILVLKEQIARSQIS